MIAKALKRVMPWFPAFLLALTFAALPAHGQFWEKKDWREWSKQECEKLLTDSPWAKKYTTSVSANAPGGIGAGPGAPEAERNPTIEYIAQLRSALPIRQALIRSTQIQTKYDKMSEAEKKSFDDQANQYLSQSFDNRMVVHVYYSTNVQQLDRDLAKIWQTDILRPEVEINTYLVGPHGDHVQPARYIRGEGSARDFELIFPKDFKGAPMVTPEDRELQLQLPGVAFRESRILIQWDLRKMKYRGNLEY